MIHPESEDMVRRIIELESGAASDDSSAPVLIRWALVAEVLDPGDREVSLEVVGSDNLTSWQARGLAWALEQQAADLHFIVDDDEL